MKRMKELPRLETRTVALLTGLAVGLAIAVHDIFFVVAALVALVGPIEAAVRWIHKRVTSPDAGAPALAKAPQSIRRVERIRYFPGLTSFVIVAFLIGFLVISGESLLYGGRSDSTPKVILAVSKQSTADALPAIIANLQNRGFRLVTVSKLLGAAPKVR